MKLTLEYKKARKEVTCPPETDPAWFFGFCFGSSEEQANGQVTSEPPRNTGPIKRLVSGLLGGF